MSASKARHAFSTSLSPLDKAYTITAMPYSALTVANTFLELAAQEKNSLTNMKLQKLVYIAHGYYLAYRAGEPLIEEDVKAWQWGPVIVELYEALKKYGAGFVSQQIHPGNIIPPAADGHRLIENVWKVYKKFTGFQLSTITHRESSPWSQTWDEWPYGTIPNDLIAAYYRQLIDERRQAKQKPA